MCVVLRMSSESSVVKGRAPMVAMSPQAPDRRGLAWKKEGRGLANRSQGLAKRCEERAGHGQPMEVKVWAGQSFGQHIMYSQMTAFCV